MYGDIKIRSYSKSTSAEKRDQRATTKIGNIP